MKGGGCEGGEGKHSKDGGEVRKQGGLYKEAEGEVVNIKLLKRENNKRKSYSKLTFLIV